MAIAAPNESSDTLRLREFAFSDEDFEALRTLVRKITGISLTDQKREMVYGRLSRRLRALQLRSFREYRELLAHEGSGEIAQFCNAITTNLTAFFREPHHFSYLRTDFLERLLQDPPPGRRLRIWSAGCSTGEEPYSIAMTLLESVPDLHRWDIRVLATDLDSDVLRRAREGVYAADRVQSIDPDRRARFFRERDGSGGPLYEVAPELAQLVVFKQLNLIEALPMKGPLDVVFCRNVIIYFDRDTQRDLFARVARLQRPNGLLFLGHSESLFKITESYSLIGKTIYRRMDDSYGEPLS